MDHLRTPFMTPIWRVMGSYGVIWGHPWYGGIPIRTPNGPTPYVGSTMVYTTITSNTTNITTTTH